MGNQKNPILTFTACLLALLIPFKALAGGWAVITLDELPSGLVAGQPVTVGFTVLQHGRTPLADLSPTVSIEGQETGASIVVAARPEGAAGHYTAELLFPVAGTWAWSIQAFSMDQPMPPLAVSAGLVERPSENPRSPSSLPLVLGIVGLACLGGALLLLLVRTRPRRALALLAAGLLLGGAGFAYAASQPSASPSPPVVSNSIDGLSPLETGQRLFVAKGCTTCHAHEGIDQTSGGAIYVDTGRDLSDFSADPQYLSRWLAEPASIRPQTEMPDLGLDQAEIEALIAFLNAE